MGHDWSSFQRDIFTNVAKGDGHTMVEARAGTGKTTTIVEALKHVPRGQRSMLVAFNKSIARELGERAPEGVRVSTLHSHGLGAVRHAFGKLDVEEGKARRLLQEQYPSADRKVRIAACRTASLAKANLLPREGGPAPAAQLEALLDQYWIADFDDEERANVAAMALWLLEQSRDVGAGGTIDFDDMIWLPAVLDLSMYRCDRLFVDEAQDLNPCQHWLVRHSVKRYGRLCAIGDPKQAIYQFRGACENSMQMLGNHFRALWLPLSITYRCPRKVVEAVRDVVPDFEAAPGCPEGVVEDATVDQMLRGAEPGDFILSRVNAPLVKYCLQLLADGKRATILGRNIGRSIVSLIDKNGAATAAELRGYADEWWQEETDRILHRDPDADVGHLRDRRDCLLAISEGLDTVDEVKRRAEQLFEEGDPLDRITLASTHRAKGLERNRVWMLRWTYLRGRSQSEQNLYYVACTRAKQELRFVQEDK